MAPTASPGNVRDKGRGRVEASAAVAAGVVAEALEAAGVVAEALEAAVAVGLDAQVAGDDSCWRRRDFELLLWCSSHRRPLHGRSYRTG